MQLIYYKNKIIFIKKEFPAVFFQFEKTSFQPGVTIRKRISNVLHF